MTYDELYKKYSKCNEQIINEIDSTGFIMGYKYKDILERVEELAKRFKKYHIDRNDNCLICANDGVDFVVYFLLLYKLNSTAILVDKNIKRRELNSIINKVKPSVIMSDTIHKELFKENDSYIFIDIHEDEINYNNDVKVIKNEDNKEAKCVIYSSGTTSKKSGIIHKTSNIYEMIKYTSLRYKTQKGMKFLTIVPNSHIYGLCINTIYCTYLATKVYYFDSLDPKLIFKMIKKIKPNYFCGVSKFYELLYTIIKPKIGNKNFIIKVCLFFRKYLNINLGKFIFKELFKELSNMCLVTAGSPIEKNIKDYLFGLGFPLIEFYGSTETGVPIISTVNENRYTYGIGKVMEPNQIKIKKSTQELLVKNDYMLLGYIDNKEEYDNILENGYINTGDIVKKTLRGIYVVGRTKETIVLSTGEKVSPEDIESYFKEIKGVKDYSICGIPEHEKSHCDKIHMFIVKTDTSNEKDIINEIKNISKELSNNMKIHKIHFVDEIPRTSIGKAKKYLLKKMIK